MRTFLMFIALTSTAWAQAPETAPTEDAPAANDADQTRARELYQNGQDLYEEGSYGPAISAFQEAYRLSGRKALLFNIGNAQERMGDLDAAVASFNEFRAFAPAEERESLSRRVAALERRIEERDAEAAATAAAAPAVVPTLAPDAVPARPPVERLGRSPGRLMTPIGGAAAVAFGTVAAVTFAQGSTWEADGNKDAWDTWRPINNASVILAGTGAAVALTGLLLPKSKARRQARLQPVEQHVATR